MDAMLAALRGASTEKIAEFRRLLHIDGAPVSLAPSGPKGTGSVASSRVKNSDIRVFPEWPLGDVTPDPGAYDLPETLWRRDVCMGRVFDATPDKRWSIAVYRQGQCCKPVLRDGLCEVCARRQACYDGKSGNWLGTLDEPVPDWAHTGGTMWFFGKVAEGKLFFHVNAAPPGAGAGSEPAVVGAASTASSSSVAIREAREAAEAKRQADNLKKIEVAKAEKERKEALKEAEKAKKEAEREAKKAAAAAEREAKKAAAVAARAAEKAQRDAEKAQKVREAAAAAAAAKAKKTTTAVVAAPVATKPAAPVEPTEASVKLVEIDGETYALVGGYLHMFDADGNDGEGAVGARVGKLEGAGTSDDPYRKVDCDDDEEDSVM